MLKFCTSLFWNSVQKIEPGSHRKLKKEKQLSKKVKLICNMSSFNISSSKTVYYTMPGLF